MEFSSAAEVQGAPPAVASALYDAFQEVGMLGAEQLRAASPCLNERPVPQSCVSELVTSFGKRAFRRPVTTEERAAYEKLFADAAAIDAGAGLEQVLQAMLLSPHTLFRMELGAGDGALTAHERASAMSYLLTDGPPDAELLQAADSGSLTQPEMLQQQARRLLATSDGARGLLRFFAEYVAYDSARNLTKSPELFPEWGPELGSAAAEESRRFIEQVLWQGDGQLSTLLTGTERLVNGPLARLYGVQSMDGPDFVPVSLPPERAGLLGQASFLAREAHADESDAVKRGKYITSAWLCSPPPPPPPDVPPIPPKDGTKTQRERLAVHSANPACSGCHLLMDPLGLAFENFDAIGRFRAQDEGKPIDPSGRFEAVLAGNPSFANGAALSAILAQAPEVRTCVATKLYRYAFGRRETQRDACLIQELSGSLSVGGGDIKEAVVELVSSEAFLRRALEVLP
jgi:hypothetical protein